MPYGQTANENTKSVLSLLPAQVWKRKIISEVSFRILIFQQWRIIFYAEQEEKEMLSAITKPTELIVDIQLEQRKNPDGTIQIFYRKSDGVLYAVNGSAAKLQDGEAIVICSESAQIAAADITAEAFARLKRISA